MRANKIVFMPLNGYLDLMSYFSWSLIGDQIAIKRRQKNEFIALGIKRQNALFHALPLAPFTAWLHLIYIQPPAIVNNNTNENSVTQNGKKKSWRGTFNWGLLKVF